MQGENNNGDSKDAYLGKLTTFVKQVRDELGFPDARLFIGAISGANWNPGGTNGVYQAQVEFCANPANHAVLIDNQAAGRKFHGDMTVAGVLPTAPAAVSSLYTDASTYGGVVESWSGGYQKDPGSSSAFGHYTAGALTDIAKDIYTQIGDTADWAPFETVGTWTNLSQVIQAGSAIADVTYTPTWPSGATVGAMEYSLDSGVTFGTTKPAAAGNYPVRAILSFGTDENTVSVTVSRTLRVMEILEGDVFVVQGGTGTGSFWNDAMGNIQDAVTRAAGTTPKGTVYVGGGTYTIAAALTIPVGVTVKGGYTMIDGVGVREMNDNPEGLWDFKTKSKITGGVPSLNFTASSGTLDGFELIPTAAKEIPMSNGTIQNCVIENQTIGVGGNGTRNIFGCKLWKNCKITTFGTTYNAGLGTFNIKQCWIVNNSVSDLLFFVNNNASGNLVGNVENCLVANNNISSTYSTHTGAIGAYGNRCDVTVNHCTVVKNSATGSGSGGGGIFRQGGTMTVKNSIVWGNSSTVAAQPQLKGVMTLSNCAVQKQATMTDITTGDEHLVLSADNETGSAEESAPRFGNPSSTIGSAGYLASADWRLQANSRLINAGAVVADESETDLTGAPRVWNNTNGGVPDIGAYELQKSGELTLSAATLSNPYNGLVQNLEITYSDPRAPSNLPGYEGTQKYTLAGTEIAVQALEIANYEFKTLSLNDNWTVTPASIHYAITSPYLLFASAGTVRLQAGIPLTLRDVPLMGTAQNFNGDAIPGIIAWSHPDSQIAQLGIHYASCTFTPDSPSASIAVQEMISFWVTDKIPVQFSIDPASLSVVWDGNVHVPAVTANPAVPFNITYPFGLKSDVGSYTFTVLPQEAGLYEGMASGSVVILPKPILAENVTVSASSIATGHPLSLSNLTGEAKTEEGRVFPGLFSWTNPETIVTADGDYAYTFTPVNPNYAAFHGSVSVQTYTPADPNRRYVTISGGNSTQDGLSWETAYGSEKLQTAIDEDNVTEVWVSAGTYYPTLTFTMGNANNKAFRMKQGVNVYGGFKGTETTREQRAKKPTGKPWDFANETILSGDLNQNGTFEENTDAPHVVYFGAGGTSTAAYTVETVLEGFTVTGGYATTGGSPQDKGGGVWMVGKTVVSQCIVRQNKGKWTCGGILMQDDAKVMESLVTGNIAESEGGGGICVWSGSGARVSNCTVSENSANGTIVATGVGGGIWVKGTGSVISNSLILMNKTSCGGDPGAGVYFAAAGTIQNCVVAHNHSAGGGGCGIAVVQTGNPAVNVLYCTIVKNSTTSANYAALRGGGANTKAVNCIVNKSYRTGTNASATSVNEIRDATAINTIYFNGSTVTDGGGNIVAPNNTDANWAGFVRTTSFNADVNASLTAAQKEEVYNADWHLTSASPAKGKGTFTPSGITLPLQDIEGTLRSTGAFASTLGPSLGAYEYPVFDVGTTMVQGGKTPAPAEGKLYVTFTGSGEMDGSSWVNALPGGALSDTVFKSGAVIAGLTEVHVGSGTYVSAQTVNAFVVPAGVEVYGGYPAAGGASRDPSVNPTILTKASTAANTRIAKLAAGSAADSTIFDGFTVTGGSLTTNAQGAGNVGAGIWMEGNSIEVRQCRITENTTTIGGGGIYMGGGLVDNCIIQSNTMSGDFSWDTATHIACGAGVLMNNDNAVLRNSLIDGNLQVSNNSDGAGIACRGGLIENCTISNHLIARDGAGIYLRAGTPTVRNCRILNNKATTAGKAGGGIYAVTASTIENCTISGNTSITKGGGVYIGAPNVTLRDCVISENTATTEGGGVYTGNSSTISGCLIGGNTATTLGAGLAVAGITATVTNTVISNNTGMAGGIAMRAAGGVLAMTNCSVVRNIGTATGNGTGIDGYGDGAVTITLKNTIVWGNSHTPTGVPSKDIERCTKASGNSAANCLIGTKGTANGITANSDLAAENNGSDPAKKYLRFVSPSTLAGVTGYNPASDWRLEAESASIDEGQIQVAANPDKDGNVRPGVGTSVYDIGAYEYQYPEAVSIARISPANGIASGTTDVLFKVTLSKPNFTGASVSIPLVYSDDQGNIFDYILSKPDNIIVPSRASSAIATLKLVGASARTLLTVTPTALDKSVTMSADVGTAWIEVLQDPNVPSVDQDGYRLIESDTHLNWFAGQVNLGGAGLTLKAKLNADIDIQTLANLPIKNFAGEFSGNLKPDGSRYTLTVKSDFPIYDSNKGLFYKPSGTLKNFNMVLDADWAAADKTGLLVSTSNGCTVENVNLTLNEGRTLNGLKYTGLMIGMGSGVNTLTRCHLFVNGTLTAGASGDRHAGGFAGRLDGAATTMSLNNCIVEIGSQGAISATNTTSGRAAGMIAWHDSTGAITLNNCTVYDHKTTESGINGGQLKAVFVTNGAGTTYTNSWYLYCSTTTPLGYGVGTGTGFRIGYSGTKVVLPLSAFTLSEPINGIPSAVMMSCPSNANFTNVSGLPGYIKLVNRTALNTTYSQVPFELQIHPDNPKIIFPYTLVSAASAPDVNGNYQIHSQADWNFISDLVDSGNSMQGITLTLNKNITTDGEFKVMGRSLSKPFNGKFTANVDGVSGKPYKITVGANISAECGGVFGACGPLSEIKNASVTVNAGVTVLGTQNCAGGLVGYSEGLLTGCAVEVNGKIEAQGATGATMSGVGGLAGRLLGPNSTGSENIRATACHVKLGAAAELKNSTRNENYQCLGGFAGIINGCEVKNSILELSETAIFSGSGRIVENGLFIGRANNTPNTAVRGCYAALKKDASYPFARQMIGTASDAATKEVGTLSYGNLTMFAGEGNTIGISSAAAEWTITPDPIAFPGFTVADNQIVPPNTEAVFTGNFTFANPNYKTIVLPYYIPVYSQALKAAGIRYVTLDGAGESDGWTWGTASSAAQLSAVIADPLTREIRLAGGTYPLTATLALNNAELKMSGGWDSATGTQGSDSTLLTRGTLPASNRMMNITASDITVSNLIFDGGNVDVTQDQGGAVHISTAGAHAVFENCTIKNASANLYGGGIFAGAVSTFKKCLIKNNKTRSGGSNGLSGGGGIYFNAGASTVEDCIFDGNQKLGSANGNFGEGGGACNIRVAGVSFNRCIFANNAGAFGSKLISTLGNFSMANSLVIGNSGDAGSGIFMQGGSLTAVNCTFANNAGSVAAGGSANRYTNCLFANNANNAHVGTETFSVSSDGSLFGNVPETKGIVNNWRDYDWSLKSDALSCINKGSNTAVVGDFDLKNDARIQKYSVDIGAYESDGWGSSATGLNVTVNNGSITDSDLGAGGFATGDLFAVTAAAPEAGKLFDYWSVDSGTLTAIGSVKDNPAVFVISGDTDVLLTAKYKSFVIRYVTVDGTGDGTSWDTSAPFSNLSALITAADEVRIAGSETPYTLSATLTVPANKILSGGWEPATNSRSLKADAKLPWEFAKETVLKGATDYNLSPVVQLTSSTLDGIVVEKGARGVELRTNAILRNSTVRYTKGTVPEISLSPTVWTKGYGTSQLENCLLFDNELTVDGDAGASALGAESGSLNVYNCAFIANRVPSTGTTVTSRSGTISMTNCLFANNQGGSEGAIGRAKYYGNIKMVQCTIANTKNIGSSEILFVNSNSDFSVKGSLFYGNRKSDGITISDATSGVSSSGNHYEGNQLTANPYRISYPIAGVPEISADALTKTDWRLNDTCPAIDKGDNANVSGTDLSGRARVVYGIIDIGAYEHQGPLPVIYTVDGKTYTGSPLSPAVTSHPTGIAYSVTGGEHGDGTATQAGRYDVTVTSTDPMWYGSVSGTFEVFKKALPGTQVKVEVTGDAPPVITVEYKVNPDDTWISTLNYTAQFYQIVGGKDSAVGSQMPTAYGNYRVLVTLTEPNYTGNANTAFSIENPIQIDKNSFVWADNFVFNNDVQDGLTINAIVNGTAKVLEKDKDYTLLYTLNSDPSIHEARQAGTYNAYVVIPGIADSGFNDALEIAPAVLAPADYEIMQLNQFAGAPRKVSLQLIGEKSSWTFEEGKDYAIRYEQNGTAFPSPSEVGAYDVFVSFMGNYAGTSEIRATLTLHDPAVRFIASQAKGEGVGFDWDNAIGATDGAGTPAAAIQETLALDGVTTVYLKAGTYTHATGPTGTALNFARDGQSIFGGFPDTCIGKEISIRDCLNTPSIITKPAGNTSAIVFIGYSKATIDGLVLDGNSVAASTSGIGTNGAATDLMIRNCTVRNVTGGGIKILGANTKIENCNVTGNSVAGSGGGIYVSGNNTLIKNSRIVKNSSTTHGAGIAILGSSTVNIYNTLVANNSVTASGRAGGIEVTLGTLNLYNSTVIKNNAGTGNWGGGIGGAGGQSINIYNSIVWGNKATGLSPHYNNISHGNIYGSAVHWGTSSEMASCTADEKTIKLNEYTAAVSGPAAGATENALSKGPRFKNIVNWGVGTAGYNENNDWSLADNSMLINRGSNDVVSAGAKDLNGKDRIQSGYVDLGAYESDTKGNVDLSLTSIEDRVYGAPFLPPALSFTAGQNLNNITWTPSVTYAIHPDSAPLAYGPTQTPPFDAGKYTAQVSLPESESNHWDVTGTGLMQTFSIIQANQTFTATCSKADNVYVGEPITFAVSRDLPESSSSALLSIDGGEAQSSLVCSFPAVGTYQVKVWIPADRNFYAAAEQAFTIVVNKIPASITVTDGTASSATAYPGQMITLTANSPEEGKFFEYWSSENVTVADSFALTTTFVMPGNDPVSLTASFKEITTTRYVTQNGSGPRSGYSWAHAAPGTELQTMLNTANVDEVRVANGTYTLASGFIETNSTFSVPADKTLSGGWNPVTNAQESDSVTILSAAAGKRVVYMNAESTLKNCTVTGANITGQTGAGIYMTGATVSACIVERNTTSIQGGAVCAFSGTNNIENTLIRYNKASQGAGIAVFNSTANVNNTLIANNSASDLGGGIALRDNGSKLNMNHCTVVKNTATAAAGTQGTGYDGGGDSNTRQTNLVNCIFWGNARTPTGTPELQLARIAVANMSTTHCIIGTTAKGTTHFAVDNANNDAATGIRFAKPSATAGADDTTADVDWRLASASSLINRGADIDGVDYSVATDISGTNLRKQKGFVDIGAYESAEKGNLYYTLSPSATQTIEQYKELPTYSLTQRKVVSADPSHDATVSYLKEGVTVADPASIAATYQVAAALIGNDNWNSVAEPADVELIVTPAKGIALYIGADGVTGDGLSSASPISLAGAIEYINKQPSGSVDTLYIPESGTSYTGGTLTNPAKFMGVKNYDDLTVAADPHKVVVTTLTGVAGSHFMNLHLKGLNLTGSASNNSTMTACLVSAANPVIGSYVKLVHCNFITSTLTAGTDNIAESCVFWNPLNSNFIISSSELTMEYCSGNILAFGANPGDIDENFNLYLDNTNDAVFGPRFAPANGDTPSLSSEPQSAYYYLGRASILINRGKPAP